VDIAAPSSTTKKEAPVLGRLGIKSSVFTANAAANASSPKRDESKPPNVPTDPRITQLRFLERKEKAGGITPEQKSRLATLRQDLVVNPVSIDVPVVGRGTSLPKTGDMTVSVAAALGKSNNGSSANRPSVLGRLGTKLPTQTCGLPSEPILFEGASDAPDVFATLEKLSVGGHTTYKSHHLRSMLRTNFMNRDIGENSFYLDRARRVPMSFLFMSRHSFGLHSYVIAQLRMHR
jgi:hypothetical protein